MVDAKEVLAPFQLSAYRIAKFEYETMDIKDTDGKINHRIGFDYDILEACEKDNIFEGKLRFTIDVKINKDEDPLIRLLLVYEAKFVGNKKAMDLERFVEMMKINGITALLHIARSYILTTSAAAGVTPPIKIPLVNVYRLKEKIESDKHL